MVSPSHSASSHPPCLHRYRSRRHGLPYNVAGAKPSLTGPWPTVSSRGYSRASSELATSHSMGGRLCVPELGSASISLKNIPNGRRIRDALAPQSQPRTHGGSAHQAFSGHGGHNGESPSSSVMFNIHPLHNTTWYVGVSIIHVVTSSALTVAPQRLQ